MTTLPDPSTFTMDGTLPALAYRPPVCGHCGEEVLIEDSVATCSTCLIEWDSIEDGATGKPDPNVESEVSCEILSQYGQRPAYAHGGRCWTFGPFQPCILPAGHGGEHLNPYEVTCTPLTDGGE